MNWAEAKTAGNGNLGKRRPRTHIRRPSEWGVTICGKKASTVLDVVTPDRYDWVTCKSCK